METTIQALLMWIASNSRYSVENIPQPAVVFMTPQQITAEYYGENEAHIPKGGIDDRIWALYDAKSKRNGVIYLRIEDSMRYPVTQIASAGWSSQSTALSTAYEALFEDNAILTERLLHELVHHVQYQTGIVSTFKCSASGEKEAYQLGGLYFKKQYIEDPMPNRNFWAHVYSRC